MPTRLFLIDTDTCKRAGEATLAGQDVAFPEFVDGWTDVMDCRHPPYTDHSIEHNCKLADHVRKPFILVADSQIDDDAA